MKNQILISLCTTCHNRAYQLKRTFAANAAKIAAERDVEWIIWNHGSEDDLHAFVMSQLPAVSRRVRYATDGLERNWHASVAKNIAHRLGRGRILMNLDCDNFIAGGIEVIRAGFRGGCRMVQHCGPKAGQGTYGRIALARAVFYRLRGYDESFYPMGFQDTDLMNRAMASGMGRPARRAHCPPSAAVQNSKADSMRHCGGEGLSWSECARRNVSIGKLNLVLGRYRANAASGWRQPSVRIFRGGVAD